MLYILVFFCVSVFLFMPSVIKSQLTLEQRAQILAMLAEGKSERSIAKDLGTSKGTVGRVKREQETIEKLMDSAGNIPDHLKKRKIVQINPKFEAIENALVVFLDMARERGMPVSGPMLIELGKREAQKRGIKDFCASEGWIEKVKKRDMKFLASN